MVAVFLFKNVNFLFAIFKFLSFTFSLSLVVFVETEDSLK